jgi:transposase-like protein
MFAIFKRQHAVVVEPGGAAPNNDIAVFQRHASIKRRCASMAGFKSFANAAITIAGIELAH